MLETSDEKLATQGGMVRQYSVQYPAGVNQQETIFGNCIVLVLDALVKDLERGCFDGV